MAQPFRGAVVKCRGFLVPNTIANVLAIKETPGEAITQTLLACLKGKQLLLVLDNCEHVLDAAAHLVDSVLHSCPKVKIMMSSREALGIAGESAYRVPSLSLPDLKQPQTPESISECESVRLFVERAIAAKADFAVIEPNVSALASICHRLDGIPFAIELAASRVRSLSVKEIDAKLDNRFQLLTGGSRTALPRHQTLQALIDWSFDLLTEQEKALLCRLSVFAGGWTLEAGEQVCAGEPIEDWDILNLLTSLINKSIVVAETQGHRTRYRLLETMRQFAWARMNVSGRTTTFCVQHRDYFLRLAETAEMELRGTDQAIWLERLTDEHDNLRAALDRCEANPQCAETGLQLAGALWRFWWMRGHWSEGRARISRLLAKTALSENTEMRAKAKACAGILAVQEGDYVAAGVLLSESLTVLRVLENQYGIALSLIFLGNAARSQSDFVQAESYYEESLSLFRAQGDKWGTAIVIGNLGTVASAMGDTEKGVSLFRESLTIARQIGDKRSIASMLHELGRYEESLPIWRELGEQLHIAGTLGTLGEQHRLHGDDCKADLLCEESVRIYREMDHKGGLAVALHNSGWSASRISGWGRASSLFAESLRLSREIGDETNAALCLVGMAAVAHATGDLKLAVRLLAASDTYVTTLGVVIEAPDRAEHEHITVALRSSLCDEDFAVAWAEGRAMTIEQAISYALEEPTSA